MLTGSTTVGAMAASSIFFSSCIIVQCEYSEMGYW